MDIPSSNWTVPVSSSKSGTKPALICEFSLSLIWWDWSWTGGVDGQHNYLVYQLVATWRLSTGQPVSADTKSGKSSISNFQLCTARLFWMFDFIDWKLKRHCWRHSNNLSFVSTSQLLPVYRGSHTVVLWFKYDRFLFFFLHPFPFTGKPAGSFISCPTGRRHSHRALVQIRWSHDMPSKEKDLSCLPFPFFLSYKDTSSRG